jgi:hypothetical protein
MGSNRHHDILEDKHEHVE